MTVVPMAPERAARLLEKWISFYGMDDTKAWPPEDYAYVKRACDAMRLAIGVLNGNSDYKDKEISKAVKVLKDWPTMHSMDDADMWEAEDFPFVRNALQAIMFAASFLNEQKRVNSQS